jgi:hypothetical protein
MSGMPDQDGASGWAARGRRLGRHWGLVALPGRKAGSEAHARTLLVSQSDGTIVVAVPDWTTYEVTRGFRLTITRASGDPLVFERDEWATYRYDE